MPILGIQASEGLAPGAPTIGTATAGDASATVAYTAPTWPGKGSGAVTYTATSSPGSFTGTGSSPITVSGLTNGTAYTFTVKATTSYGVTGLSSSASNSVTPVAAATADYESIQTVSVGSGGSSSISFTSIPSTYKHLQIRMIARTNRASTSDWAKVRFNSDSTSVYAYHDLYGEGSGSPSAYSSINDSSINMDSLTAANSTANIFGAFVMDILDYANTNKYKTTRYLGGNDSNGSGVMNFGSGLWRSTSAISTITITPGAGSAFSQYSHFALYGAKG